MSLNISFNYYQCVKCNVIVYKNYDEYFISHYDSVFGEVFNAGNTELKLTCNELIIKNIIE